MQQPFWIAAQSVLKFGALLAFLFILLPLGLVRLARTDRPDRLIYAGVLLLAALLLPTSILTADTLHQLPRALDSLLSLLIYLLPSAGLGLSAVLLLAFVKLRQDGSRPARMAFTMLALSALLLLKTLQNLYGLLAWDRTYDPLGILYLVLPVLVAVICGGLLLVDLRGAQRWLGLTFLLLLPGLLFAIYKDTDRIDIVQRTQANARAVSQSIEAYRATTGGYPAELRQLSPWYALAHPRPWIIAGQDWCYQGTGDAYRLGYVYREHWSSPNLIAKTAAQGGSPVGGELCAAEIDRLERRQNLLMINN